MSTFKRCISLLLVLGIILGVLVPAAQAAPVEETASVDTDNVTIEGTNGFGNLLSQEITENQAESKAEEADYPGGYTVTNLEIEGNTATVTYDTMEEATLVVALYTEDGMQMLTSTTATVSPDATEAELIFEGNMPEYFMASAYLLDSYDFSPLCAAYDTPMYTREMQELLASTVEDYDPEKILNLDEDNTTNFAVYAESTIVIDAVEGVNTVTLIDDENATYVIENADEQITSLVAGNVFVYPYAEGEILIVKVAKIEIEGATATITGTELELEEVFAQMKIESSSETADMTVDDSTAAEGISYVGLEEEGIGPQAWEGGGSASSSHTFKVDIEKKKGFDHLDASFSVTGSLKVSIDVDFNYYISLKRQYIQFKETPSVNLGVTITGNVTGKYPIGNFGVSPVAGVYIGFSPEIQLKFDGAVELSANVSMTIGFSYSSDRGFENLTTKPKVNFNLSSEGTLFFGVDFKPNAKIIHEKVASFTVGAAVGFELTAKMSGTLFEYFESDADKKHTCTACLGLDVDFKATLDGELKFLNCDWLTLKVKVADLTFDLGSWHRSSAENNFKKGECKNYTYRLTIFVTDNLLRGIPDISVTEKSGNSWGTTNEHGAVVHYVPRGHYTIQAVVNGESLSQNINIEEAMLVTMSTGFDKFESIWDLSEPGEYLDDTVSYEGHTYQLIDISLSWAEAQAYCEQLGGYLATINSKAEMDFVVEMLGSATKGLYWLGMYRENANSNWRWVTGEAVNYTNWAEGEPNNISNQEHYVHLYSDIYYNDTDKTIGVGTWNDTSLYPTAFSTQLGLICEWNPSDGNNQDHVILPNAAYGGEYGTTVTDSHILKSAFFRNLVPGEQYVLLAMTNMEDNPLSAENLLFIDQAVALEDGTLKFQYVQRTPADFSYVVACGASNKNLQNAEINFPVMKADGDIHVIEPTVVYDGKTLIAGQDYVITGSVDYTEAGEYTCYIRGIREYTGIVECIFAVKNSIPENPFTDVAPGSFFYEPVMWAIENGITNGTSATTFGPNDQCMRAHVVTFLWRAVGSPEPTKTDNPFVDVKPTDFYYKPVLWAVENGITSGMDATHFGPTAYCNRAQVVTFLYRTMGSPDVGAATNPFTDVAAGSFYEKPVLWAVENGVTAGLSATSFGPNSICNRAQIVTFLYRAFVH